MMKILTAALLLSLSFTTFAQSQKQLVAVGVFEMLLEGLLRKHSVPMLDYVLDYQNKDAPEGLSQPLSFSKSRLPNIETTFAFTNTDDSFEGVIERDLGVCRGYSSLRRKVRFLGHFDPKNTSGIEIPDRSEKKRYTRFYKNIFKKIRNYKSQVIPGFSSLHELSQDPLLSKTVKWQVIHEWRDKNFSFDTGSLNLLKNRSRKSSYESMLELRTRIHNNETLGHNTLTWLTADGSWIHVLEAFNVSEIKEDGSFVISFWNDKFVALDRAVSTLRVAGDGGLYYSDTIQDRILNSAGVSKENDAEMVVMSKQRLDFCSVNSALCGK